MESGIDRLMLLLILSDMALLGMTRLGGAIGLIAFQGVLLGGLALLSPEGAPTWRALLLAVAGLGLRGVLFPWLLRRVVRRVGIRHERDPLIGHGSSILIGIAMLASAMALGSRLPLKVAAGSGLVVPAALFTILTGVFVVITRRKALTQCLGYLVLENGIYGFGLAAVGEVPALVELGALLDVFVAVLVMGVAVYRLAEEFDHMDTDQLTMLRG
jgi:hydrogenase-4 component E